MSFLTRTISNARIILLSTVKSDFFSQTVIYESSLSFTNPFLAHDFYLESKVFESGYREINNRQLLKKFFTYRLNRNRIIIIDSLTATSRHRKKYVSSRRYQWQVFCSVPLKLLIKISTFQLKTIDIN